MKLNNRHKKISELRDAGWSMSKIGKKIGISKATVSRYIKQYERIKDETKQVEPTNDKLDSLVGIAWETLEECLKATKLFGKDAIEHPDYNVRLSAASKILSAKGLLVEQTKVDHTGDVNHHHNMREKLQQDTAKGLQRFNVNIPVIVSDN